MAIENLAEARHLCSSVANDISDPIIVGGQSALGKIGLAEYSLQARALAPAIGIRRMATIATVVVDPATCGLLGAESKFGVAFAALQIAAAERERKRHENDRPE